MWTKGEKISTHSVMKCEMTVKPCHVAAPQLGEHAVVSPVT